MNDNSQDSLPYKRILLKLSGESLMGDKAFGIDEKVLGAYAAEVRDVVDIGAELAIVIGGGNIFRGVNNATKGMTRSHADYMGMLATMINAMALQDALEQAGIHTRLQSSPKHGRNCRAFHPTARLTTSRKRDGSSFLVQALAIHISPRTQQLR